ncbi:putative nucleotidyltransferase, ribonuclease H [Tanacetum coccineum]
MTEPEPVKRSKKLLEQERQGLEEAIRLQKEVDEEEKAQIARDEEIARQLLALDEERVTTKTKTTKDIDWNDPSVQKYWDKKNKPKSEAQARKNMIKPAESEEIEEEKIEKDTSKKTTGKRKKSLPRTTTRSSTKKQKGVKERYSSSKLEGYDLMLWGDLHTLFEPGEESEIWICGYRRNSDDDVPNFEAMIAAAVANALPNLTAALRTQITNDIRNGAESSGGSGGGGDATPQGIHVWIKVLGLSDNFKTRLACVKLEGDERAGGSLIGVLRNFRHMNNTLFGVEYGFDTIVDRGEICGNTWTRSGSKGMLLALQIRGDLLRTLPPIPLCIHMEKSSKDEFMLYIVIRRRPKTSANWLPINCMLDFDVILGMDWLLYHRVLPLTAMLQECDLLFHRGAAPGLFVMKKVMGACVLGIDYRELNPMSLSLVILLSAKTRHHYGFHQWTDDITEIGRPPERPIYADREERMRSCVNGMSAVRVLMELKREIGVMLQSEDDDGYLFLNGSGTSREGYDYEAHSSPFGYSSRFNKNVKIEQQRASGFVTAVDGDSYVEMGDEIFHGFVNGLAYTQEKTIDDAIWPLSAWVVGMNICAWWSLSYNNSWAIASIKAASFELLIWLENVLFEQLFAGMKKKLKRLDRRQNALSSWICIESDLEFQVGTSRRVIFEIIARSQCLSYISFEGLALPPQLSHVHNVFHVSLLRGYKYHPLHVVSYPFDQIREDLSYTEEPESILDRQDRVMRNKTIPFVKILWRNHPEREATWETEESIRTSYPHFLP